MEKQEKEPWVPLQLQKEKIFDIPENEKEKIPSTTTSTIMHPNNILQEEPQPPSQPLVELEPIYSFFGNLGNSILQIFESTNESTNLLSNSNGAKNNNNINNNDPIDNNNNNSLTEKKLSDSGSLAKVRDPDEVYLFAKLGHWKYLFTVLAKATPEEVGTYFFFLLYFS